MRRSAMAVCGSSRTISRSIPGRPPAPWMAEMLWVAIGQQILKTLGCLLSLALLLVGCNRGPAVGTVKGTITIDGQPVDGGLIRLVPADGNSQPADCVVQAGTYTVT